MRGVKCPYCGEVAYSAYLPEGKQRCIYCKREFSLNKNQLKSATNPIQGEKGEK